MSQCSTRTGYIHRLEDANVNIKDSIDTTSNDLGRFSEDKSPSLQRCMQVLDNMSKLSDLYHAFHKQAGAVLLGVDNKEFNGRVSTEMMRQSLHMLRIDFSFSYGESDKYLDDAIKQYSHLAGDRLSSKIRDRLSTLSPVQHVSLICAQLSKLQSQGWPSDFGDDCWHQRKETEEKLLPWPCMALADYMSNDQCGSGRDTFASSTYKLIQDCETIRQASSGRRRYMSVKNVLKHCCEKWCHLEVVPTLHKSFLSILESEMNLTHSSVTT